MTTTATTDETIKDLILEALRHSYVAANAGVETGNHYQSIKLGDIRTAGFREDRGPLLDQIDFDGKKVLDLGCNLGELSRAARLRGARLVDGFEFDPYFVEIANLINVFTDTTRVSFFRRDISNPASYAENYDIVLAFAVLGQGVGSCLPRLAEITDVVVLETHKLEGNFETQYVGQVSRFFPHYRIIGQSEWGREDSHEVRAVAVFAKDSSTLSATVKGPTSALPKRRVAVRTRDHHEPQTRAHYVDVERTNIHDRFFSNYSFDSPEELLDAVDGTETGLDSLMRNRDAERGYGSWVYWFLYLKGYCQYSKSKEIGPGNVYYGYLVRHHRFDPVLTPRFEDHDKTVEHMMRLFRDMDHCRFRESDDAAAEGIRPVHVVLAERPLRGLLGFFEEGREEPLPVKLLDGWHRIFAARVFGVPRLRSISIDESGVGPILGSIEVVRPYEEGLELQGWCLDPRSYLDRLTISTEQRILPANDVVFQERTDVREAFPQVPHALESGFKVRCDCHPEQFRTLQLELTAFRDHLFPLGKMGLHYAAGLLNDLPAPPATLSNRLYGITDPAALALRSLTTMHNLVEPIARFRALGSFRSVLDFGCGTGLLEQTIGRFFPEAEITAIEFDQEAIDWCRSAELSGAKFIEAPSQPPTDLSSESFDLVLASCVFSRLGRDGQFAWLEELYRVMNSAGYAAVTVLGELALEAFGDRQAHEEPAEVGLSERVRDRGSSSALPALSSATLQTRAYTVEQCERWFDVIAYVEGGVANQHDLIVLRKA